jgi:hypothetical protein
VVKRDAETGMVKAEGDVIKNFRNGSQQYLYQFIAKAIH